MANEDENLFVKFYKEAVKMGFKSEKAGHPVYEDRDFISIVIPGDASTLIEREVNANDKERFYKQWDKYERNETQDVDGWKIEAWPQMTPASVQQLKHMGFYTVEQLAAASDGQITKMMGGLALRAKAQAAVQAAEDSGAIEKYAAENLSLRSDIEDLKRQVAELATKAKKAA